MALLALALAGCSSLSFRVTGALARQNPPSGDMQQKNDQGSSMQQQNTQGNTQQQKATQPAANPERQAAYETQFNTYYGSMWNMGWTGYQDSSYRTGQGTVWRFSSSDNRSGPVTFERAFLRRNADSTQWWRFRLDTGRDSIMYEFLVDRDGNVRTVRYKDPGSGAIMQFVPTANAAPPGPRMNSRGLAELRKHKADKRNVMVQAGSFNSDYYVLPDAEAGGTSETWVSESVPGVIVKAVFTNDRDKQTSMVELVTVESGMTTTLGSY